MLKKSVRRCGAKHTSKSHYITVHYSSSTLHYTKLHYTTQHFGPTLSHRFMQQALHRTFWTSCRLLVAHVCAALCVLPFHRPHHCAALCN